MCYNYNMPISKKINKFSKIFYFFLNSHDFRLVEHHCVRHKTLYKHTNGVDAIVVVVFVLEIVASDVLHKLAHWVCWWVHTVTRELHLLCDVAPVLVCQLLQLGFLVFRAIKLDCFTK